MLDYLCEVWTKQSIIVFANNQLSIPTMTLGKLSGKFILSTAIQPTTNLNKLLRCVVLLFCVISLGGCTKRQIAESTRQMDAEPQFWIRVLLLDDINNCTLNLDQPFTVINPQAQIHFDQPETPISISISAGKITFAGCSFTNNEVVILPDEPHIFNLNGDDYRGKLKLTANPDANSFDAVNLVPLESYLAGVVGLEMPDYWEPEALKAQTIAARTYCLYIKKRFGSNRSWDVTKTQANQVYHGVSAESNRIRSVVNQTYGQVLACKKQQANTRYEIRNTGYELFPAYYSSICGGHTENSKHVFGGNSFEPLSGVVCPYCRDVAKHKFFFWPARQFDKNTVTAKLLQRYPNLKKLGEIKNIIPTRQSNYGKFSRLTLVRLLGSTGESDVLRAEDFRLSIDPTGRILKSTICKIADTGDKWAFSSGRGYGHGVGMCQCGAEAMARQGKTAEQILSYYYPGSKILTIYK